jgi:hypothetical protein
MMVNGNYLIHAGFSPKIESGFTLSDILEEKVDAKYFLSEKAVNSLITNKDAMQKATLHPVSNLQEIPAETTKE